MINQSHDVTTHPIVKKLKDEAKTLKKSSELSLMQAQTAVAKNNGYNSWHDFLQKIKNIFSNPQDPYEILLTSASYLDIPEKAFFHIGEDVKTKKEQWFPHSSSRHHFSIFEEHSSINSIDVYIAKQAIVNKRPLVFVSSDIDTTKSLMNFAISQKRKQIFLFDCAQQIKEYKEYTNSKLTLNDFSAGAFTDFIQCCGKEDMHSLSDLDKNHFFHYLHLITSINSYQKECNKSSTNLDSLLDLCNITAFETYLQIIPDSHYIYVYLKQYVMSLSISDNYDKHVSFHTLFTKIIEKMKATCLFQDSLINHDKLINFNSLLHKDENSDYPIFIFLTCEAKLAHIHSSDTITQYSTLINYTLLQYYRHFLIYCLSGTIEGKAITTTNLKRGEQDAILFVMREPSMYYPELLFHYQKVIGGAFVLTFNHIPHLSSFIPIWKNTQHFLFGKFTNNIIDNKNIFTIFNDQLSANLLIQSYSDKPIKINYKANNIENLAFNEYIISHTHYLKKIVI